MSQLTARSVGTSLRSDISQMMALAWGLDEPVIGLSISEPAMTAPDHLLEGEPVALSAGIEILDAPRWQCTRLEPGVLRELLFWGVPYVPCAAKEPLTE